MFDFLDSEDLEMLRRAIDARCKDLNIRADTPEAEMIASQLIETVPERGDGRRGTQHTPDHDGAIPSGKIAERRRGGWALSSNPVSCSRPHLPQSQFFDWGTGRVK